MTFDDDMLTFRFDGGTKRVTCKSLGLNWPPPEHIDFMGFRMFRNRLSVLTDEQRQLMPQVIRGAEYLIDKGETIIP